MPAALDFRRRTRRTLCCAALFLTAACSEAPQPDLRVGSNPWPGYETLYLARERGYYGRTPPRLVELTSATQAMDALRADRLDVAALTLDEALTLAAEGSRIRVIWVMDVSAGADALLAQPGIDNLKALRGRRIGVENSALGAYMLAAALKEGGLTATDITVVHLPLDEHVKAFRQHKVDALVTFEPVRQHLLRDGAVTLFDSRQIPGQIVDVLVVRENVLDCCEPQLRTLIEGQQQALAALRRQPDEVIPQMALRPGLQPDEFRDALEGMTLPDLQDNRRLLAGAHPLLTDTVRELRHVMQERGLLDNSNDRLLPIDSRFTAGSQP